MFEAVPEFSDPVGGNAPVDFVVPFRRSAPARKSYSGHINDGLKIYLRRIIKMELNIVYGIEENILTNFCLQTQKAYIKLWLPKIVWKF